jgi:hypothetical protein
LGVILAQEAIECSRVLEGDDRIALRIPDGIELTQIDLEFADAIKLSCDA